ncbi:MAG: hypothetical protein U0893_07285 [Chloroflexota bacterium]
MRVGRLILVVATLVTIVVFPLLMRDALQALRLPNAYAAPAGVDPNGRVYKDGNNNDNNKNNNNNNNNNNGGDENNDNDVCYASLNDNEEVPCDNTNGNANANDNVYTPPPPPPSEPAPSGPQQTARRCYSAGETGYLRLELIGGTIVIHVVPPAGFAQDASIRLDAVDPATVPTPPSGATLLDTMVWRMSAGSPCDGPSLTQLPGDVNLGIPYTVSANKSKLQIVYLQNNAWVEVPTTPDPDPNKAYISATIHNTGTYAVIQKP